MSDDTPTERFESPTPTAPTAPLPSTAAAASTTEVSPDEKPKRGMLIALLSIAGAILIALIILIVVMLNSGGASNEQPTPEFTASESPSPTPTVDETETPEPSDEPSDEPSATTAPPPPPPQSPSFATFSGTNKAACPDTSSSIEITWSWSSSNAVNAWFGIGTNNAKLQPYEQVPTTASYTFYYQCSEASQIYTVTLEDSANRLTHKTVEIVRQ